MAIPNRASLLNKVYKSLKNLFQPVASNTSRTVLDHLLFACLLEDSHYPHAEEAYQAITDSFYDLNEVRVSSIKELAEVTKKLCNPEAAASRLKRTLHSVFESSYSFDLEMLKKLNLGVAAKKLIKFNGTTSFAVSFVVQSALAGHSIPVSNGSRRALFVLGVINEAEEKSGRVPGLERAISKRQGIEFGSLLHQLGSDFFANPYQPSIRKLLLSIEPECKIRLPKRPTKAQKDALEAEAAAKKAKARLEQQIKQTAKLYAKPTEPRRETKKQKQETKSKSPTGKSKTPLVKKATPKKKKTSGSKKKPTTKKKTPAAKKKVTRKKKTSVKKKSSTKKLSKQKPR